jgi:hypothetical protein
VSNSQLPFRRIQGTVKVINFDGVYVVAWTIHVWRLEKQLIAMYDELITCWTGHCMLDDVAAANISSKADQVGNIVN